MAEEDPRNRPVPSAKPIAIMVNWPWERERFNESFFSDCSGVFPCSLDITYLFLRHAVY